jgi:tRNA(Ile2) C34 agmatinyltransferase TiaS
MTRNALPPFARPWLSQGSMIVLVAVLTLVTAAQIVFPGWVQRRSYVPPMVLAAVCIGPVTMALLHRRRVARLVRQTGGCMCLRCGYDMRNAGNLPSGAPCPECGTPFDREHAARVWRAYMHF